MIELSMRRQTELIKLFLKQFGLEDKYEETHVYHPKVTNTGCVHIDVGVVNNENVTYYFTFGCSAKENSEGILSELFFQNSNDINGAELMHEVAFFNNRKLQLILLKNGEYLCFDNSNPLSKISAGKFTGFFIYDSFTVTASKEKEIHYYECVPVTKTEIAFVESHPQIPYQILILEMRDHLGCRSDLKTAKGLSQEQLDKILDVFNAE